MKSTQSICCLENKESLLYPDMPNDTNRNTAYTLEGFLGEGSFATCYVIREYNSLRAYAAKILEKKLLEHPLHSSFLLEELAIHRLLRHKNIVTFYQVLQDEHLIYIVLELCSNGTLKDLQKRRQCITLMEAKYYLHHIINGVCYLHYKMHIVHGDLKLSNIFINSNMEVKIGDFGLATAVSFEGDRIRTQCGTPNYMAPEIVQKKGRSYAGDIWAIGCILYGLLVGRPPFQTCDNPSTIPSLFEKIKRCDYSVYEPGLRKYVSSFIRKILQKNPEDRPTIIDLKNDKFMSGFVPLSLPKYTLWEPPLPKDLIPGIDRLAKNSTIHHKSCSLNRNLRKRMKRSITRLRYTNQIAAM